MKRVQNVHGVQIELLCSSSVFITLSGFVFWFIIQVYLSTAGEELLSTCNNTCCGWQGKRGPGKGRPRRRATMKAGCANSGRKQEGRR
eukprot:455571-Hanusia_phi.AAC.5